MSDTGNPLEISRDIRLDGDRALRASVGEFGFTITEDEVFVVIPDRFGNSTLYNFSHPDWDRVVELLASTRCESI